MPRQKPAPAGGGRSPRDWWSVSAPLGLVFAVGVAWWGSLDTPFLFDDHSAIVRNASLRSWRTALFPPADVAGVPNRPLVNLSLAFNHALGGTGVRGYHLFNTALHAGNALLLHGLLRRMLRGARPAGNAGDPAPGGATPASREGHVLRDTRGSAAAGALARPEAARRPAEQQAAGQIARPKPGHLAAGGDWAAQAAHPSAGPSRGELSAFALALLWAVHPLQTESVTFVIQRTELLGAGFILLALMATARAADCHQTGDSRPGRVSGRARVWVAVAIGACVLGALAKEIVAVAPVLALLYDRTFVAGSFAAAWRARGRLYAGMAVSWLVIGAYLLATPNRGGSVGFGLGVGTWEYLLTQCRALVLYLKLSLWPNPLVVDYGAPVVRSLNEVWWQGTVVLGLLAATVWALVRRPALGFVGAWFFVILAPSSSFVPLTTQTMAEHRMYLPLAAVLGLVVLGVDRLGGRKVLAGFTAVAAVAAATGTIARNRDYASAVAIWSDTVAGAPGNHRAHYNLANALVAAGRTAEAVASYERAAALHPGQGSIRYNLGAVLLDLGRVPEAIAALEAALRLGPDTVDVRANLGAALAAAGRTDEAIAHYVRAAELDPRAADLRASLGELRRAQGDPAGALREYEAALALQPGARELRARLEQLRRELRGR